MSTILDLLVTLGKIILGTLIFLGTIIYPFFIILLPTFLNFAITALCVLQLKKLHSKKLIIVPVAIALSFLFAMNVRVIDVISDLTTKHSHYPDANKKITLAYGTTITLNTNIDSISYKKNPLSNPMPRHVSSECMCFLYSYPKVITENVKKTITDHGLIINNDKKNTAELNIKVHSDEFIAILEIQLSENGNIIAKKKVRLRQKYYGDLKLTDYERSEYGNPIPYLSRNTLWNLLVGLTGRIPNQKPEILNFINESIIITPSKTQSS